MSIDEGSWFAWYPVKARTDRKVRSKSWEARALWRELLDILWTEPECKLETDLEEIANLTGIPLEVIERVWPELIEKKPLFDNEGDFFYSRRLLERRQHLNQQIEYGKKGAAKRWGNREANRVPNGGPNGVPNADINKDIYNNNSLSKSALGGAIGSPSNDLHARAVQQVENLMDQVQTAGSYKSPEGRDKITLRVMLKTQFNWRSICSLNTKQIPFWKDAFVAEYKKLATKTKG